MIDSQFDDHLASVRELLPNDGTLLFDCASLNGYSYYGMHYNTFSMINTENDDVPFGKAYRVNTSSFTPGIYEQVILPKNEVPVQWGDMVFIIFYARSVIPQQETGMAMHAGCGTSSYTSREISSLTLGPPDHEWTPYYFFGKAHQVYNIGELLTFFFFSHSPQTIDIGGFIALNLGQGIDYQDLPYTITTYPGREEDAPWRAPAAQRIEEHRKGDLLVQVVDGEGVPVSDANVSVEMKRHAFKFGTLPFWMFNIWQDPDVEIYREKLLSLFNAATTGFFMGTDEWGWYAQPESRPIIIAMAEWLQQHNMDASGTTLIYPGWSMMPSFFYDLADDPEALHTALIHHLDTIVPIGRDAGVDSWDVINEQTLNHEVMDILGDEVLIDWFEHTHFLHPEAQLGINDFNILMGGGDAGQHANLVYLINMLQNANAPIHRLGFQSHFNNYLPSIDLLFEILEDFSVYDLNIHISEFDIDIYDEEAQADFTRDFMTIMFSHPSVNRFTHWGFWEATMYIPNGAMFRTDWTEKPNYFAYTDLLFNQWWTEEEGLSNDMGEFFVRGFLGDYEITVMKDGLISTLDTILVKDGTTVTLVLAEPPVTYNLDLDVNPPGTGVVTCAGEYEAGTQVNISAIADSDWMFVNWTGDTDHVDHPDSAMAIVNMPATDVSLTAHFEYSNVMDVPTLSGLRTMPTGETIYRYTGEAVIVAIPEQSASDPFMYSDFEEIQNVTFGGWPNSPTIVDNPDPSGINTSSMVGEWQRSFDPIAHVSAVLDGKIDFSSHNVFRLKIWSPVACEVLFKLEDKTDHTIAFEVSQYVSITEQWVELIYDFSDAQSGVYDKIVIFMDFLSSDNNIFYFDDITGPAYEGAGKPGSLPFESHTTSNGANPNRMFIQDETAAIYLFDAPGNITTSYNLYDVITNVTGQIEVLNNMIRFLPLLNTPEASDNTPVEPVVYDLHEVTYDDQARLIKFSNISFEGIEAGEVFNGGQNYNITDGTNTFVLRTLFLDEDYIGMEISQGTLNLTGVITQFNDIMQITPRFATDMEELPDLYSLTLNVDMRRVDDFSPNEDVVHVTGSMLDWAIPGTQPDNQLMTLLDETMIWTKTFSLEEGEYEYKYFLNTGWDNGEWSGEPNRIIWVEDDISVYNAWGMMGEAFLVNFSVKDENGHTIDDAVITVNSFTHNAGEYEIGYLPAGQYDYHVHHNDYLEATGNFSISGEAVWVNVLMTADDTAINDMEDIDLKIFPNPVQNTLFVEANMMITDIHIIDMPGRPVLSVKVQDRQSELDLSSLYNGIYFIRVYTDKGIKTLRVMVVR